MERDEFLIDTHLLLWAAENSPRLSRKASTLLSDPDETFYFSAISISEIAIKHALKKADFIFHPAIVRKALLQEGFIELPFTGNHAIPLADLPLWHRDPFDRMLVAQALSEQLTLVTSDEILTRYPGKILLV